MPSRRSTVHGILHSAFRVVSPVPFPFAFVVCLRNGLSMDDLIDVFPSAYSCNTTRLNLVNYDDMRSKSIAFVSELSGRQVTFKSMPSDPQTNDHFRYAWKEASSNLNHNFQSINWDKVRKRLQRVDREKRNKDVTLAFNYGNVFLTKKYFTFGIRRTGPDDCHVYHTKESPMLFYKSAVNENDKSFPASNAHDYDAYILECESSYLVSENTTYIIVTMNKCIFAVDKLRASDINPLLFRDPTERPVVARELFQSKKRKFDVSIGEELPNVQRSVEVEESAAHQKPQSIAGTSRENNTECPQTLDSHSMSYDSQPVYPSTSMDEVNESGNRCTSSCSSDASSLQKTRDAPLHLITQPFNFSTPKKSVSSSAVDYDVSSIKPYPIVDGNPIPFQGRDEAGNTFLYTPIDMKWSGYEPLSRNVHPFLVQTNGKVYIYVPIKE